MLVFYEWKCTPPKMLTLNDEICLQNFQMQNKVTLCVLCIQ